MGALDLKDTMGKVIGTAAAAFADNLVASNFTSISQTMRGIGFIGLGLVLPSVGKNNKLLDDIGFGCAAVGTIELMKSFSVISGMPARTYPTRRTVPLRISGYNPAAPVVGAAGKPFLTQTVGTMPSMEAEMMGALLYED